MSIYSIDMLLYTYVHNPLMVYLCFDCTMSKPLIGLVAYQYFIDVGMTKIETGRFQLSVTVVNTRYVHHQCNAIMYGIVECGERVGLTDHVCR